MYILSTTMASETYAFQAEINQLLSLIINAFYSNKEVFLRELLSNASDALDKIRYKSLTEGDQILRDQPELRVRIVADKEARTLAIEDTGIGMTKEELVKNLGTIAHSGTKAFVEALKDGVTDMSLIGQFGMGFYSAFLVADKVVVTSKSTDNDAYVWESTANGSFTITAAGSSDALLRGTRIVLHIKEDQVDFLNEARIREVVTKYSQFITFPIELEIEREVEEEVINRIVEEVKVEEGKVNEEDAAPRPNTITVKKKQWEVLNKNKPLWTRPSAEITQEEYAAFYRSVFDDWEDHLAVKHFSVEGQLEYKALMFVPKRAPFNMFNTNQKDKNMKLYVRRVFITDDCEEELFPLYLSFVKGIVDTNDLPLNVSREMLQQNSILRTVKKGLVKKCIEMFQDLADNDKDKFKTFYESFGKNLKLGVYEDAKVRDKLVELLRFYSTKSENDYVSLKDYVTRMKEGQHAIYYITGETLSTVKNSALLEGLLKRGYEVLYMVDPIDEYMMQQLTEYDGKKFVCCAREDLVFDDDDKEVLEKKQEEFSITCKEIKKILDGEVMEVKVSMRATDTPCVLVAPKYGWTANMERIMRAQALRNQDDLMFMEARRIMEINPEHKMIQEIKNRLSEKKDVMSLVRMMFDTALLASGFNLKEPSQYAQRVFRVMMAGLALDDTPTNEEATVDTADGGNGNGDGNPADETVVMEEVD